MGVPGLFIWLVKKYKHIIKVKLDSLIDVLYLDANCLIHPITQKVLQENKEWTDKNALEQLMLDEIILYIELLIEYVGPRSMVYIAVDGVAPCAKIKHQRSRRFKSIKYMNQVNSIKRKYGQTIDNKWSNASITPGTEFMEKITNCLNNYVLDKPNIIFSSAKVVGEGEHKILQHINTNVTDEKIVIYGLDADLIYLALSSQKRNISLLREVQHLNNKNKNDEYNIPVEKFNYLCIDTLRSKLIDELTDKIDNDFILDNDSLVKDFIFIGYFMGNDFLPHVPSIEIMRKGLDILLSAYVTVMCDPRINKYFFINDNINTQFLQSFMYTLAKQENDYFYEKYNNPVKKYYNKDLIDKMDPLDKELDKLNNLRFHIHDPIKLGSDYPNLWKDRYYNINFGEMENIDDICKSFLDGLYWTSNYYFKSCCSWSWYYPYNHAPMMSDLFVYLNENIDYFTNIKLNKDSPLCPFEQLLAVLPPACAYLLPKSIQYLMLKKDSPLIDLYPHKFEEDLVNKQMLWQGIPLLPKLDIYRIKKHVSYKGLKEELIRNQIIEN